MDSLDAVYEDPNARAGAAVNGTAPAGPGPGPRPTTLRDVGVKIVVVIDYVNPSVLRTNRLEYTYRVEQMAGVLLIKSWGGRDQVA